MPDSSDACPTTYATTASGCPETEPPPPYPVAPCSLGRRPDHDCTPGAVFKRATARKVCRSGYTERARNVSQATKERVYERYGVVARKPGEYEVDHLVPLSLGGSNALRNLWPQRVHTRWGTDERIVPRPHSAAAFAPAG